MKIKLLCNIALTNYYGNDLAITCIDSSVVGGPFHKRAFYILTNLKMVDVYLVFNPGIESAFLGFLHKITGGRAKVVFWDVLLHKPNSLKSCMQVSIKKLLFRYVDMFFVPHRNTEPYLRYYGIGLQDKFLYVPFKANNYEMLDSIQACEGRYILSCGASYRDYDCLVDAAKDIKYPVKIVLPEKNMAVFHNTRFSGANLPRNVEVVEHNGEKQSWNEYIAAATMVVIPISKDCIQPAGISVYLEAMALGKPVIISKGASTEEILDEEKALFFEPGNSKQLKLCIEKLLQNSELRQRIAAAGQRYALSLEGTARLVGDLERNVLRLFINHKLTSSPITTAPKK